MSGPVNNETSLDREPEIEENESAPPQMNTITETSTPAPLSAVVVKSQATPQLPLARVKNIMKFDSDVSLAGGETVYLVAKCTELFIAKLAEATYQYTVQGKRKTIQKKDFDQSIHSRDYFSFLDGIFDRSVL